MNTFFVILIIILIINILTSTYCFLRTKMSRGCGNDDQKEEKAEPKKIVLLVKCLNRWISDAVFLYSKIVGYIPCHTIRIFMYKYIFHIRMGKHVTIHYGMEVRDPWNLQIGDGTIIGDKAILDARSGIILHDNVNLSTGVWLWTMQHDVNSEKFEINDQAQAIEIENRVWLSCRVTILPGVRIAEGCVVAAGATVTRTINEPFLIVGGIPAHKIGERNCDLVYNFDGKKRRLFI